MEEVNIAHILIVGTFYWMLFIRWWFTT